MLSPSNQIPPKKSSNQQGARDDWMRSPALRAREGADETDLRHVEARNVEAEIEEVSYLQGAGLGLK